MPDRPVETQSQSIEKPSIEKPAPSPEQQQAEAAALRLFDSAAPSVVRIISRSPAGEVNGVGTGFFVDNKGTIATDLHCVNESADLFVEKGHTLYQAEVTASSKENDLALLRTSTKIPSAKPIDLADPNALKLGDTIYGIGHANGASHISLSIGKFSETLTQAQVVDRISTDNALTPELRAGQEKDFVSRGQDLSRTMVRGNIHLESGMSGGPLLNSEGKAVGVIDLKALEVGYSTTADSLQTLMNRGGENEFIYTDIATSFGETWKEHWKTSRADQVLSDVYAMTRAGADIFASKFPVTAGDGTKHDVYGAQLYVQTSLQAAREQGDFKPWLASAIQTGANAVALGGLIKMDGLGQKISGATLVHAAALSYAGAHFIPQRHIVAGRKQAK